MSPIPEAVTASGLRRHMGLASATAVVVGEIIGIGIFLTPAGMTRTLGAPLWILVVWLVMGAMALAGALCYGELAARFPQAGGGYVYLREAFGRRAAFLYGWKCMLVLDPGLTAALGVGAAAYVGRLVPLAPGIEKLVAVAAIATLAGANVLGLRLGTAVMRALTALKLGLLAVLLLWGLARGLGDWGHFLPFAAQRAGAEPLVGALAGGFVSAFFAFGGWWDLSKLAGEVREPERNVPRALALGVLVVTLVYVLTSAVFLYLVPVEAVTSDVAFAAQAGRVLFGAAGEKIFAGIVVVSVLGSLASLTLAAPRVYYAMARDGLFAPGLAALHPRFGTPARAIALQAGLASVMVALGSFEEIVGTFLLVTVLFIGLTVAAVFRLPRPEAAFRSPLHPWPALLFLFLVVVLGALLVAGRPKESLLGVAIVSLGLPVYGVAFRKRQESAP
jgi:basic amino acid/polyamine antiporter, APA family